jgi:hypothetical protein
MANEGRGIVQDLIGKEVYKNKTQQEVKVLK